MAGIENIKVIVAAHKPYPMPADTLYLPVLAGARQHDEKMYTPDDTGENISKKNPNYCELTALYWAWKNLETDRLGLCHYRRYFMGTGAFSANGKEFRILGAGDAAELLEEYDVILPKKRNYYIETTYSQYAHAHHRADLDTTRQIILEKCPEYLKDFDRLMEKTEGHKFNMFLMKRRLLDRYCTWLFGILFELEKRLDISHYSANDARVFGFVAERLLDVWLDRNGIGYCELSVVNCESQNWPKKGAAFLGRRLKGRLRGNRR